MKRLPRALPKPTVHIIDRFHLAMKIQPIRQISDRVIRWRPHLPEELVGVDRAARAIRCRLWHGRVEHATNDLDRLLRGLARLKRDGDMAVAQLHHLAMQLSSYIRSNRHAIIDYGARYRAGCRVATTLGESAVNSLVAKRMVKKQQMRWSQRGAHIMLQVRAATINGDLRARLREQPQAFASSFSWIFNPIRPLLQTA
ncbi:MAG: hypothetical protein ABSE69_07705 [Roseiarcus sp.]